MIDRPTCLADLMDEKILNDMIAEGYVRRRPHPSYPLFIYNYSEKAMFEQVWNKATTTCRGLIADKHGVIVARPWPKFFNSGDARISGLMTTFEEVEITDKADGSLGIGYSTPDGYAIATRGSFSSDQAIWATEWLRDNMQDFWPTCGLTPLFEIVYQKNRIVLDYGTWEGLILLGGVDTTDGTCYGPYEAALKLAWQGQRTEVFPERTIAEFMAGPNVQRSNAEGVVARAGHRMLKIKQEDYVKAHAVVTGLSNRAVWENLSDGYGMPEQAFYMPDEFYAWLIRTAEDLTAAKVAWETEVTKVYRLVLTFMPFGGGRADFAKLALQTEFSAALFKLYDNKSIEEMAWQAVRPAHFERPFSQTQDNN